MLKRPVQTDHISDTFWPPFFKLKPQETKSPINRKDIQSMKFHTREKKV